MTVYIAIHTQFVLKYMHVCGYICNLAALVENLFSKPSGSTVVQKSLKTVLNLCVSFTFVFSCGSLQTMIPLS